MQKTRRILALALPWFPAERILRRHPALKCRPFVLSEEKNGRRIVAACNPAAARAGYAPGLAIADARAIEPDLPVFEKKAEADTAALSQLALWAGRYTPYAAPAEKHTLFLDISGCAHLHGDEKGLAADAIARLAALGFTVLAGIADTPGAAWALAL
jgi:protein ImuB